MSELLFISKAEEFGHNPEGRREEQRNESEGRGRTDETLGSFWLENQERSAGKWGGKRLS